MARRLAGVRRVTLSVPGVLLEEKGAEELDESASVRQDAAGEGGGWHVHPPTQGRMNKPLCCCALLARHAAGVDATLAWGCSNMMQARSMPCPPAAELVRQIAARADCYLMCHVSDDIGEALVRGALEHAGITGSGPGQVPPHRCVGWSGVKLLG